jgi:hypothetical protein
LLVVAAPGIARAARRFERDGDQFMLVWLVFNIIVVYVPFDLQRRLFIGLIIPLAYFGVRAIEDYWLPRIKESRRRLALLALLAALLPTNLLILMVPLFGVVVDREAGADAGILIEKDYVDTFDWLAQNGQETEVVLASPLIGSWTPAHATVHVVYGHPFETVRAKLRKRQVENFFGGKDCDTLLSDKVGFKVDYIIWGPREETLGLVKDTDQLKPGVAECRAKVEGLANLTQTFGDVTLYILREPR